MQKIAAKAGGILSQLFAVALAVTISALLGVVAGIVLPFIWTIILFLGSHFADNEILGILLGGALSMFVGGFFYVNRVEFSADFGVSVFAVVAFFVTLSISTVAVTCIRLVKNQD